MLNIIYICSKCESFQRNEKKVSCTEGMWQNVTLKDALLYTPWDFECLSFNKCEKKKEKLAVNDSTS